MATKSDSALNRTNKDDHTPVDHYLLRDRIIEQWPHLLADPTKHVHILANVTCHGQSPRDVDLLLIADLGEGEDFEPLWPQRWSSNGESEFSDPRRPVRVRQLCVAIELKDTDSRNIRFEGTRVEVAYANSQGWHDASTQAEKQPCSSKKYLQSRGLTPPFIASILWLRNCPMRELPPRPHNRLGDKWNWNEFLSALGSVVEAKWFDGGLNQAPFGQGCSSPAQVVAAFSRKLEPSRLDRRAKVARRV